MPVLNIFVTQLASCVFYHSINWSVIYLILLVFKLLSRAAHHITGCNSSELQLKQNWKNSICGKTQSGRGHTSSFTTRHREKYIYRVHAATIICFLFLSYFSVCSISSLFLCSLGYTCFNDTDALHRCNILLNDSDYAPHFISFRNKMVDM